jgi:hypothetical protein
MSWYICDKKNLPWFLAGYNFYSTLCVFSIPLPRLRDRKHTTLDKNYIWPQTMGEPSNF